MAGGVKDMDVKPGDVQQRTLGVGVGVVKLSRGKHGRQQGIFRAKEHPAAGIGGQIPHRTHMVKMTVGQQNGFESQPQGFHFGQDGIRLIARIDDTAGSGSVIVDDVGVGLVQAKGKFVDFEHKFISSARPSAGRCPESGSQGRR